MGYHHCPIEPDDYWTYGPAEEPECPTCEGTGEITKANGREVTCPDCGGSGYQEYEPLEDDVL